MAVVTKDEIVVWHGSARLMRSVLAEAINSGRHSSADLHELLEPFEMGYNGFEVNELDDASVDSLKLALREFCNSEALLSYGDSEQTREIIRTGLLDLAEKL